MNAYECLYRKSWSWALSLPLSLLTKSSQLSCPFPSPLFLTHSLIDHANEWQECSVEIFGGKVKTSRRCLSTSSLLRHLSCLLFFLCHLLSISHTLINTRKRKITSSFVIITLSAAIFLAAFHFQFSSVQVIRGFEPKTDQICHRKQLVRCSSEAVKFNRFEPRTQCAVCVLFTLEWLCVYCV